MDLFDFNRNEETAKPLAERMRANTLEEFIGQKHIVAEGSLSISWAAAFFGVLPGAAKRRSPTSLLCAQTESLSSSMPSIRA